MSGLVFLVIVFIVISAISDLAKKDKKKVGSNQNTAANRPNTYQSSAYTQTSQGKYSFGQTESRRSHYSKPVDEERNTAKANAGSSSAGRYSVNSNTTKTASTIVDRAKANTDRLKGDETLRDIEASHGHSESEAAIEMDHSRNCQTLTAGQEIELEVESHLGTTEDLIVKGYSGDMTFERDFIGEAQDLLSRISLPPS